MTKPYSVAFEQKVIQRLTGWGCASQSSRESGVRQQNPSQICRLSEGWGGVELALGGGREVAFLDHGHERT